MTLEIVLLLAVYFVGLGILASIGKEQPSKLAAKAHRRYTKRTPE